jgi:plastocyanin
VRRPIALAGALAALAALAAAPAASAADQAVQAVDGTAADNFNNRWAPAGVTIAAGETVTWNFAGTAALHNVASRGANWSFRSGEPASGPPSAAFRFTTPGVYAFVCEVHVTTMAGTVTVTDAAGTPPPPPPPPPLSEQPWPNDQPGPTVLDLVDEKRPKLTRVRVEGVRNGARVRFRLSERARVTVRFKRQGRTVKTRRRTLRRGAHGLTVRDRRMRGRYRLEVRATDLAGNRSRVRRARVTIGG